MLEPIYKNSISKAEAVRSYRSHSLRLKQIQSDQTIKATLEPPVAIDSNPKRDLMLQTKYTEIQRENRLLFEKISRIMKDRKSHSQMSPIRSLNNTYRKKQNKEIAAQNMKILERIKKQKPSISFTQTQKSFWEARKLSANISHIHKYEPLEFY